MPCIVKEGKYSVYVYGHDHNPPHCHVYWNGTKAAVVSLQPLVQSAGNRLPKAGLALIQTHLEELLEAWQQMNP